MRAAIHALALATPAAVAPSGPLATRIEGAGSRLAGQPGPTSPLKAKEPARPGLPAGGWPTRDLPDAL